MKIYKKYKLLFISNFLVIILFLFSMIYFTSIKYNTYTKINAFYIKENTIRIIVNNKILNNIEKNDYIYIRSHKKKIKIISITKNIYETKKESYHEVFINIESNIKNNIEISIFKEKKKLITMFKDCWKEK